MEGGSAGAPAGGSSAERGPQEREQKVRGGLACGGIQRELFVCFVSGLFQVRSATVELELERGGAVVQTVREVESSELPR